MAKTDDKKTTDKKQDNGRNQVVVQAIQQIQDKFGLEFFR